MRLKPIKGVLMVGLLISMLTWTFIIQQANSSEPPVIEWTRTYGGANYDWAWSVVETSDGGYALTGYTWSFGVAGPDFWLVKVDSSGDVQWDKTYGGAYDDGAYSVVETSDGGYVLAGYTNSFGAGNYDFWLVKVDASGNMQWNRTYGGTDVDSAYSVVETSDGGYALAGYTASLEVGGHDFWLVKVDASGNMQWNRTYGGTNNEGAWSVVETSDGGYVLAGVTASFGAGGYDFWLVKVDSSGDVQWDKTYGGANNDVARSGVETSDGGYALAGYTASFGAGGYDFWLVKVDSSGNLEWNKTYGGPSDDVARSLVKTSDGGYAIAGHTWSFGSGLDDFWLVKVDVSGNLEWNRTYGGTDVDSAYCIVETTDEGYALAGYTASFGAGGYDFWFVKVARPQDVSDVAIIDIAPSRTVIGQDSCLNINVTVQNQGSTTETFNVTTYADQDTTIIGDEITVETQNFFLASGDFTTIMFTWNTTGVAKGNYTISAIADIVTGETDTADNTFTDGSVVVAMVGDVSGLDGWPDGKVNIMDLTAMAKIFGVDYPDPRYNANYDLNDDGKINIADLTKAAKHFGETDP